MSDNANATIDEPVSGASPSPSPLAFSPTRPSAKPGSSSADTKLLFDGNKLYFSIHMPTRPILLEKPGVLTVRRGASVADIKAELSTWEGRPRKDAMKLIFRGRILDDAEIIGDAVGEVCSFIIFFCTALTGQ
jgi:hypothetical protein